MSVGTRLREARERRGITLQQVAACTKLSTSTLASIERNDFGRLPGGILTRGYLRAFAAAVEQNPEEIVREYVTQDPSASAPQDFYPVRPPNIDEDRPLREFLTLLATVALAYIVYFGFQAPTEVPVPLPGDSLGRGTSITSHDRGAGDDDVLGVVRGSKHGVHLAIQPTDLCWVSAKADGEIVLFRLVDRGERVTVNAREQVVLRVGEPGAFAYTVNGTPGRPIGDSGKPITVTITDQNFGLFQAASEHALGDGVSVDPT